MTSSKLTTKYQATIPESIREFLDLKKGDRIAFKISEDKVLLNKVKSSDYEYLKSLSSTLSEWGTEDDDEAYKDL